MTNRLTDWSIDVYFTSYCNGVKVRVLGFVEQVPLDFRYSKLESKPPEFKFNSILNIELELWPKCLSWYFDPKELIPTPDNTDQGSWTNFGQNVRYLGQRISNLISQLCEIHKQFRLSTYTYGLQNEIITQKYYFQPLSSFIITWFPHVFHYHKISNISRTLMHYLIVDHSDVVGASPVGAAPNTSSFST